MMAATALTTEAALAGSANDERIVKDGGDGDDDDDDFKSPPYGTIYTLDQLKRCFSDCPAGRT